jgi:hypothetical protein
VCARYLIVYVPRRTFMLLVVWRTTESYRASSVSEAQSLRTRPYVSIDNADVVPVETSNDPQRYLFPFRALLVASVSWLPLVVPLSLMDERRCQCSISMSCRGISTHSRPNPRRSFSSVGPINHSQCHFAQRCCSLPALCSCVTRMRRYVVIDMMGIGLLSFQRFRDLIQPAWTTCRT